jgi:hypothetical protein
MWEAGSTGAADTVEGGSAAEHAARPSSDINVAAILMNAPGKLLTSSSPDFR